MPDICLTREQSRAIAQNIYADVKQYALDNCERYVAWFINDVRKSKNKPPLEPIIIECSPCVFCDQLKLQEADARKP